MSNTRTKTYGVLGYSGDVGSGQRSVMDRKVSHEYNMEHSIPAYHLLKPMISEQSGVLGSAANNQRSVMDKRMASSYNPNKSENYRRSAEHYQYSSDHDRTATDRMMQREFNPSREPYFQPRHSMAMDDPYNPLSYDIQRAPIM